MTFLALSEQNVATYVLGQPVKNAGFVSQFLEPVKLRGKFVFCGYREFLAGRAY